MTCSLSLKPLLKSIQSGVWDIQVGEHGGERENRALSRGGVVKA
jgi:hypothetical protein